MTPTSEQLQRARALCDFLRHSPVNFLAVHTVRQMLDAAGFTALNMAERWTLSAATPYYVTVNDSAVFAFVTPSGAPSAPLRVIAAHSDSPCFRLKPHCEIGAEGAVKLNTEVYGGPILYTWFDRPLSLAGRVILRTSDPIHPQQRIVDFKRPLMVIPHLAIHFNREVNAGNKISAQKDMLPVVALSGVNSAGLIRNLTAAELGVAPDDILDYDLSLYDTALPTIVGADSSMICAGRLDDLSMVHAATEAFLTAAKVKEAATTRVLAIFDNEETGSQTKQGAGSTVFEHIMRRMVYALGGSDDDFIRSIAGGFLVSADNAHGFHPNYPEKYDPTNHPVLGGGPCIKINARCKYMTDADTAAVFAEVCRRAGVPFQYFVNHSDSAGGSTLGNILTGSLPLRGVDMGAPVWAMHSVSETASVADHSYCIDAFTTFYGL